MRRATGRRVWCTCGCSQGPPTPPGVRRTLGREHEGERGPGQRGRRGADSAMAVVPGPWRPSGPLPPAPAGEGRAAGPQSPPLQGTAAGETRRPRCAPGRPQPGSARAGHRRRAAAPAREGPRTPPATGAPPPTPRRGSCSEGGARLPAAACSLVPTTFLRRGRAASTWGTPCRPEIQARPSWRSLCPGAPSTGPASVWDSGEVAVAGPRGAPGAGADAPCWLACAAEPSRAVGLCLALLLHPGSTQCRWERCRRLPGDTWPDPARD